MLIIPPNAGHGFAVVRVRIEARIIAMVRVRIEAGIMVMVRVSIEARVMVRVRIDAGIMVMIRVRIEAGIFSLEHYRAIKHPKSNTYMCLFTVQIPSKTKS